MATVLMCMKGLEVNQKSSSIGTSMIQKVFRLSTQLLVKRTRMEDCLVLGLSSIARAPCELRTFTAGEEHI
jgi:hypothetical protein